MTGEQTAQVIAAKLTGWHECGHAECQNKPKFYCMIHHFEMELLCKCHASCQECGLWQVAEQYGNEQLPITTTYNITVRQG